MPSPNHCTPEPEGFTLIETAVTLGLFVIIAGLTTGFGVRELRADAFRVAGDALASSLRSAREEAMNNLHEQPHGVAVRPADHPDSLVVFEGTAYATSDSHSRDIVGIAGETTLAANSPAEILFCPLSGVAVRGIAPGTRCDNPQNFFDGTFTMTDTATSETSTITVNHEGAILR